MTATDERLGPSSGSGRDHPADPYGAAADAAEGRVYTVTGQDWDSIVSEHAERGDERIVVNMGPQHPSTHGVLRIVLKIDGERVVDLDPVLGYLHRGVEKICEHSDWHERETYDMFGIIFDGHPALTRILMPDDWPGHPQRKDYRLGGIPVEYKGAEIPPPDERRRYTS